MTSSTEHLQRQSSYDASSETEDENATALGTNRGATAETHFMPQPNIFSHPPSNTHRDSVPGSYFPQAQPSRPPINNPSNRQSYPSRANHRNGNGPEAFSPSYQADHDAALRASLTTLLSCAAAARGLPKRNQPHTQSSQQPTGLSLVPESALLGSSPASPSARTRTPPSISSTDAAADRNKRKTAKQDATRASKKKRTTSGIVAEELGLVSPTLLTWVVSAGVVVIVSAIGFSAGFAMGREAGRQEAAGLNESLASFGEGSCGREVVRSTGLRRFRLGVTS
jgi:hypothetical protein